MQALEVCTIYRQLIGELSSYFCRLFAPEVAAHALPAHELTGCSYVYAGLGPFVCLKFWHQPVLLPGPGFFLLGCLPHPFQS